MLPARRSSSVRPRAEYSTINAYLQLPKQTSRLVHQGPTCFQKIIRDLRISSKKMRNNRRHKIKKNIDETAFFLYCVPQDEDTLVAACCGGMCIIGLDRKNEKKKTLRIQTCVKPSQNIIGLNQSRKPQFVKPLADERNSRG